MANFNLQIWNDIGTSRTVQNWIRNGVPVIFDTVPEPFYHDNHALSKEQSLFVDKEIAALLLLGAIEQLDYQPHCVSALGVVPKKHNKFRLIHDLQELNSHYVSSGFQYEDIRSVRKCVRPGDQLVTLDIKEGFHHVPIACEFRDYFGFAWNGFFYRWCVLPFGWCASPYFFGKTLRLVIQYLRLQGIRVVLYVDDFLILARPEHILRNRDFVVDTLSAIGWKINFAKSDLSPSYRKLFLGYVIDTAGEPCLEVPGAKVKKLRKDIKRVLSRPCVQARVLARIAGLCISVVRAVGPGKLMLRGIYRLLRQRQHWGDSLLLSPDAINDLRWWHDELEYWNGLKINIAIPDIQVTTDASPWGYGAVCAEFEASGFWTKSVSRKCQNFREMMAILVAIQTFRDVLRGKSVQILTDNFSALTYINSGGGPSAQLTKLAKAIYFTAVKSKISISASFLAGKQNDHADHLSRLSPAYEWSLDPLAFQMLEEAWGPHQIDRFASAVNTKLPVFNSRFGEPGSAGIDALAQDWRGWNNYINPPFRMLDAVIEKVYQCQAEATVIAPFWSNQMWFHRLRSILIAPPMRIPIDRIALQTASLRAEVIRNPKWRLYAWRISGAKASEHADGLSAHVCNINSVWRLPPWVLTIDI